MPYPDHFSLEHLAEIMSQMASLHHQLAHVRSMELDHKVKAWDEAEGLSITERREYVTAAAASCTQSIWELEAEIAAKRLEMEYLIILRMESHAKR